MTPLKLTLPQLYKSQFCNNFLNVYAALLLEKPSKCAQIHCQTDSTNCWIFI